MTRVLVAFAILLMHASHADALPRVYQLKMSQCSAPQKTRTGTGFVVQGFLGSEQTPNVLITALHVIDGCDDIQVWDVTCESQDSKAKIWAVPRGSKIQVWPEWDLAAIMLPGDPLNLQRTLVDEVLDLSKAAFDRLRGYNKSNEIAAYRMPAFSVTEYCMRGSVTHTSLVASSNHFSKVAAYESHTRNKTVTADAVRGSLSPQRYVLNYFGAMDPGASGAPVTKDGTRVIAIHDAGYVMRDSGWGIVLAGSNLDEATPTVVLTEMGPDNKTAWPPRRVSYLEQSAPDWPPPSLMSEEDEVRAKERRIPSQNILAAFLDTRIPLRDAKLGTLSLGGTLEYARHGTLGFAWGGYFKLGFVIDLTLMSVDAHRRFASPAGEPLEVASKNLDQFYLAPGVDLRLERLGSWWSPSLTLAGIVGRWYFADEAFVNEDSSRWNVGALARFMNRWSVYCSNADSRCFHVLFGVEGSTQKSPNFDYRYTGIGAEVQRDGDDSFTEYLGVKLGVEWFGVGR